MSIYTFATDNFTTIADRRRRPLVDKGQLQRTLALFIAAAIAFGLTAHRNDISRVAPAGTSLKNQTIVE